MAQNLTDFLLKRGITPIGNLSTKETPTMEVTSTETKKPSAIGKTLRWIGKELMKPVGVVATEAEQIGKSIAQKSLTPLGEAPKLVGEIITGKTERSFSDIWRENLPEHKAAATTIGIIIDIAADPLNLIGGITTKGLSLAAKGVKEIPLFKGAKNAFTTATDSKTFNVFIDEMKSLGEYKKAKVLEAARDIQRQVVKLNKDEIIEVSNYIEKGTKSKNVVINKLGEELKNTYKLFKDIEKAKGVKGGEILQYAPHIKAKETLAQSLKKTVFPSKQWSTKLGGAEKGRQILKFMADDGTELIGKAENLGLKPVEGIKGLSHELTVGEFKSLKEIEKTLGKFGVNIRYKPQEAIRRVWGGYFDPIKKEIVVASKQPKLNDVVNILKHEITHNAHFQLGGNIEMLETFTGRGKNQQLSKMLEGAKNVAKEEWNNILKARNINFEKLSSAKKVYFRKPTELLAYASETYLSNPEQARVLFPKTVEAIESLQRGNKLFNLLDTSISPQGMKIGGNLFKDELGKLYQTQQASIDEIAQSFGKHFFEENPAIQMAYRGLAHSKAVTSKEFFNGVKQFATKTGVETTIPELKGVKFSEDIAKQIDNYYKAIQPEELNILFKTYDGVLNWWKAQALLAPAYHMRNFVSNIWNNFLAGIKNPVSYIQAGMLQSGKAKNFKIAGMTGDELLTLAEKRGVLGQGWYAADIPEAVSSGLKTSWKSGINPISQQNYVFRLNKSFGTALENNARLAHFIEKLKTGSSIDDAVMSVKKFLFDYQDLTKFEKTVMKRVFPFYTWTRKNIPLQLENLITQPGKYAGMEKVVKGIEKLTMGDSRPANEKYLADYIKNNTAMRVGYNEKTKSYQYFLLGNWVPSYQAIDFLSEPLYNMMAMLTPIIKTPMELLANKSSFFRNTLEEFQAIENYPGETTNFLGLNMSKKTATILRNIRLLNELDKLNPGQIFGGKQGEPSIFKKLPAVEFPGIGTISPAQYKYGQGSVQPTQTERGLGTLFGKFQQYKESTAREFYQQDTERRREELQRAIRSAARKGDRERVKILNQQLQELLRKRGK